MFLAVPEGLSIEYLRASSVDCAHTVVMLVASARDNIILFMAMRFVVKIEMLSFPCTLQVQGELYEKEKIVYQNYY